MPFQSQQKVNVLRIGHSVRFPIGLAFCFFLCYLSRKIFYGEIQLPNGEGISNWKAKHHSIPRYNSGLNAAFSSCQFHTIKERTALFHEYLL